MLREIARVHTVVHEGPDRLVLAVPVDGGRVQHVEVRSILAFADEEWLETSARVCRDRWANLRGGLERNATLAIGALCLVDGWLAIRHARPLAGLSLADLDEAVTLLAAEASVLREQLRAVAVAAEVFAHYA